MFPDRISPHRRLTASGAVLNDVYLLAAGFDLKAKPPDVGIPYPDDTIASTGRIDRPLCDFGRRHRVLSGETVTG